MLGRIERLAITAIALPALAGCDTMPPRSKTRFGRW